MPPLRHDAMPLLFAAIFFCRHLPLMLISYALIFAISPPTC